MPNRERVLSRVSNRFLDQLVAHVTAGFKGDVGVVPRQFLREVVHVMDLCKREKLERIEFAAPPPGVKTASADR